MSTTIVNEPAIKQMKKNDRRSRIKAGKKIKPTKGLSVDARLARKMQRNRRVVEMQTSSVLNTGFKTVKEKKITLSKTQLTDPRFTASTVDLSTRIQDSLSTPSLDIPIAQSVETIAGVALSVISYALARGYEAEAEALEAPYFVWIFLTQLIQQFMENETLNVPQVPRWLSVIGQLLGPKKQIPNGSGYASYEWLLTGQASGLTNAIQVGPATYGREYQFTSPADPPNFINFFWNAANVVANPYDPVAAEQYWNQLTSFLQLLKMKSDPRSAMHIFVPSTKRDKYSKDSSAYASVVTTPGGGIGATGGAGGFVTHEVPITTPLMSVFNSPLVNGSLDQIRYPRFLKNVSGDVVSNTGQMVHLLHPGNIQKKAQVNYKFIDIGEIIEVCAYYAQLLLQQKIDDPQFLTTFEVSAISGVFDFASLTLEMTFQDFALMIRALLMAMFIDTQFMVQTLYPILPNSPLDGEFVALQCAPNSCSYPGATAPLLPLPLIENLRSLTYRSNSGGLGGDKNPSMWIPVLGIYNDYVLNGSQFKVRYVDPSGTATVIPVFAPPVFKNPVKGSQKGKLPLVAESVIDLVDGYDSTDVTYVQINDPAPLSALAATWNQWVQGNAEYSVPLAEPSSDAGINALLAITDTLHWATVVVEPINRPFQSIDRFERKATRKEPSSPSILSFYEDKQILAITSHDAFIKAAWEDVLQYFILPVNHSSTVNGKIQTYSLLKRVQELTLEPHKLIEASSTNPVTMNFKHYRFAEVLTHARNTPEGSIITQMKEFEKSGRGGILTMIGGILDGVIGL